MMSEGNWIERIIDTGFCITQSVQVPEGHVKCSHCEGRGMLSKYDEGWSSIVHSEELAALHRCMFCGGRGYVVDPEAADGAA
jgi:hypothetical protein